MPRHSERYHNEELRQAEIKILFLVGLLPGHFPSTGLSSSKLIGALLFFVEIPSRSTRLVEQLYSAIPYNIVS